MAAMETAVCARCLHPFMRQEATGEVPAETEDAVCRKLGDRSLVWFLRAYREAEGDDERANIRRRFDAARGRSTI